MTADEARQHLKNAIDPGTAIAIGLGARAAMVGTVLGVQLAARKRRMAMQAIEAAAQRRRRAIALGIGALAAGVGAGAAGARLMKKDKTASDEHEQNRRTLHKIVRPLAKAVPYKTKGAKGWDVMVDAMLGDDPGTAASK